jgi:small subunit ribosomal protein S17
MKHPLYKKFITRSSKFAVHDAENTAAVGDTVRIRECRPVSKLKRFELIEKVG